jgi:hypothetical protein
VKELLDKFEDFFNVTDKVPAPVHRKAKSQHSQLARDSANTRCSARLARRQNSESGGHESGEGEGEAEAEGEGEAEAEADSVGMDEAEGVVPDWEADELSMYRSQTGGAVGMAFQRLMSWVGMECVLQGNQWACTRVDVDTGRGPDRLRIRAFSLTPKGRVHMHKVIGVIRQRPFLLTTLNRDMEVSVREGLNPRARADVKLRALIRLGCTPLGQLIDVEAFTLPQLLTLWNAIVALCNARPNNMWSVKAMADAYAAHMLALGYAVNQEQVAEHVRCAMIRPLT